MKTDRVPGIYDRRNIQYITRNWLIGCIYFRETGSNYVTMTEMFFYSSLMLLKVLYGINMDKYLEHLSSFDCNVPPLGRMKCIGHNISTYLTTGRYGVGR